MLCAFLSIPSTVVYSRFYRIANRFNLALFNFGEKISKTVDQSLIFRACRAIRDSRFVGQSAILRWIRMLGMRGLLIIAFGMYLPIDYVIRDVLQLETIGSIWDEDVYKRQA